MTNTRQDDNSVPSPSRARAVSDFVRTLLQRNTQEALESAPIDLIEKFKESSGAPDANVESAVTGLQRILAGDDADRFQASCLEAIVLKDKCPTLAIFDDDIVDAPKGTWARLDDDRKWLREFIRAVGRVECAQVREPYVGTGFLVGPDLVLTNRHVARAFARGLGMGSQIKKSLDAQLDYRREKSAPNRREPTEVVDVLMIHPYWDAALLRVRPVADRVCLKLATDAPQRLEEREIAVIGFPYFQFTGSDYDQRVLLDNFGDTPGFKRLQPGWLTDFVDYIPEAMEFPRVRALGHNASTLGGNSGSAIIDLDAKRTLALHFAGQPFVTNWSVPAWELARDSRLRDLGVEFDTGAAPKPNPDVESAWKALDSARSVISVPEAISTQPAPPPTVVANPPKPATPSASASSPPPATRKKEPAMSISVVVDIANDEIQGVRVERRPAPTPTSEPARPLVTSATVETTARDADWSTRAGYDPDFLGVKVPLPALSEAQQADTVEVPVEYRRKKSDRFLLNYHHYSVVFNGKRRIAWFSAANIDGDNRHKFERGKDHWFIDERIDDPKAPKFQMGEELYATENSDRGHLTRYLDVAWGDTKADALAATNDSFHFTNCALQLSAFNQGKSRWQGLEQYLLENKARKEKRRMSVITGPVLKRTDPVYQNECMDYRIRIPLAFWKVCALVREDGSLSVTAFVMGQPDVTDVPGFEEALDVDNTQVTLAYLEKLTKFDFSALKQFDHLAKTGQRSLETTIDGHKYPLLALTSYDDIKL